MPKTMICLPTRPVPVVMINGTSDPVVPYGGGTEHNLEITFTSRLCSVPPPYGTTGSDVPLIITTGTGRVGKQIIVFGMAAPTGAIAAMPSAQEPQLGRA